MTRGLRLLAVAAAVLAGGLAVVLVAAPPVSAHSALVASTPAEGETLAELPGEFSVTMNETLLASAGDAAFALRVRDDAGLFYGDGCLTIIDATVSTPAAIGAAGAYVLEWQVVSADGHAVGGEIAFTWTGAPTAEGAAEPAVCGELPGDSTAAPEGAGGHHDEQASEIPVTDVLWIVGAVLVVAAAVTVALIATRRKP